MMTQTERMERKAERKASEARMAAARLETQTALRNNECPACGGKVHRNSALAGWVQCNGFGAEGFRKDPNARPCNWQGFTE